MNSSDNKLNKLAKAFANWDKEHTAACARVFNKGFDAVLNSGGFAKQDKAANSLAKAYNQVYGTEHTGETIVISPDLEKAYMVSYQLGMRV